MFVIRLFAGSGTTAHAVMELNKEDGGNRKWICVQIPEETDKKVKHIKQDIKLSLKYLANAFVGLERK